MSALFTSRFFSVSIRLRRSSLALVSSRRIMGVMWVSFWAAGRCVVCLCCCCFSVLMCCCLMS